MIKQRPEFKVMALDDALEVVGRKQLIARSQRRMVRPRRLNWADVTLGAEGPPIIARPNPKRKLRPGIRRRRRVPPGADWYEVGPFEATNGGRIHQVEDDPSLPPPPPELTAKELIGPVPNSAYGPGCVTGGGCGCDGGCDGGGCGGEGCGGGCDGGGEGCGEGCSGDGVGDGQADGGEGCEGEGCAGEGYGCGGGMGCEGEGCTADGSYGEGSGCFSGDGYSCADGMGCQSGDGSYGDGSGCFSGDGYSCADGGQGRGGDEGPGTQSGGYFGADSYSGSYGTYGGPEGDYGLGEGVYGADSFSGGFGNLGGDLGGGRGEGLGAMGLGQAGPGENEGGSPFGGDWGTGGRGEDLGGSPFGEGWGQGFGGLTGLGIAGPGLAGWDYAGGRGGDWAGEGLTGTGMGDQEGTFGGHGGLGGPGFGPGVASLGEDVGAERGGVDFGPDFGPDYGGSPFGPGWAGVGEQEGLEATDFGGRAGQVADPAAGVYGQVGTAFDAFSPDVSPGAQFGFAPGYEGVFGPSNFGFAEIGGANLGPGSVAANSPGLAGGLLGGREGDGRAGIGNYSPDAFTGGYYGGIEGGNLGPNTGNVDPGGLFDATPGQIGAGSFDEEGMFGFETPGAVPGRGPDFGVPDPGFVSNVPGLVAQGIYSHNTMDVNNTFTPGNPNPGLGINSFAPGLTGQVGVDIGNVDPGGLFDAAPYGGRGTFSNVEARGDRDASPPPASFTPDFNTPFSPGFFDSRDPAVNPGFYDPNMESIAPSVGPSPGPGPSIGGGRSGDISAPSMGTQTGLADTGFTGLGGGFLGDGLGGGLGGGGLLPEDQLFLDMMNVGRGG